MKYTITEARPENGTKLGRLVPRPKMNVPRRKPMITPPKCALQSINGAEESIIVITMMNSSDES